MLSVPIEEMMKRVIHPCQRWAQLAGHADWASAIQAMKAGEVLASQGPKAGKSVMDLMLFMEQVCAEGLHCCSDNLGRVWLGLKENFPKSMLDRQAREQQIRDALYMYDEARFGGIPSPETAKGLLADLRAGRAFAHPISAQGYMQRLEDIAAGRPVDPSIFKPGTEQICSTPREMPDA